MGCIRRSNKFCNRALAYNAKEQYDMAIADCNKAIDLDPNLIVAYINRGWAHYKKGRKNEAIADLEKLITLSDDPEAIEVIEQQIEELKEQTIVAPEST